MGISIRKDAPGDCAPVDINVEAEALRGVLEALEPLDLTTRARVLETAMARGNQLRRHMMTLNHLTIKGEQ